MCGSEAAGDVRVEVGAEDVGLFSGGGVVAGGVDFSDGTPVEIELFGLVRGAEEEVVGGEDFGGGGGEVRGDGDLGGVESEGVAGAGEGVSGVGCVVLGLDPDASARGGVGAAGAEGFEVVGVGGGWVVGGQAQGCGPGGLVGRDGAECGADLVGVEEVGALCGGCWVGVEVEVVPAGVGGEVGEVVGGAGGGDGDAEWGEAGGGGVVFEGVGEVDEASGGGEDGVAELGEGGVSSGAVEEGCAEVFFEGGDASAGDGLGDVRGCRAVGEAASVADVDEGVAGSYEVHDLRLCGSGMRMVVLVLDGMGGGK